MEKLFNDSETYTKERPKKITEEQENTFCTNVANEIIKNGWSKSDVEDIVHDLKELELNENGYELAKRLEDFGMQGDYKIDPMFVEFLDCIGSDKNDILRKNVKDWVKAHDVKPKFSKGDCLIINESIFWKSKVGSEVYITGMKLEEGVYYVHENKDNNGGYVIPYETIEQKCTLKN